MNHWFKSNQSKILVTFFLLKYDVTSVQPPQAFPYITPKLSTLISLSAMNVIKVSQQIPPTFIFRSNLTLQNELFPLAHWFELAHSAISNVQVSRNFIERNLNVLKKHRKHIQKTFSGTSFSSYVLIEQWKAHLQLSLSFYSIWKLSIVSIWAEWRAKLKCSFVCTFEEKIFEHKTQKIFHMSKKIETFSIKKQKKAKKKI